MANQVPLRRGGLFGGVSSFFGGIGRGASNVAGAAKGKTGSGFMAVGRAIGGSSRVNGIYTSNGKKYIVMNSKLIKPFIGTLPAPNQKLWKNASQYGKVITLKEFIKFLTPGTNVNTRRFSEQTLKQAVKNALAARHKNNNAKKQMNENNRIKLAGNLYTTNGLTNAQRIAFINFVNKRNSNLKAAEQYRGSTSLKHFLHKLAPNTNGINNMTTKDLKTAIVRALQNKANAKAKANANAKAKANENAKANAAHQNELLSLIEARKTKNPALAANKAAVVATNAAKGTSSPVVTVNASLARAAAGVAATEQSNGNKAAANNAATVAIKAASEAVNIPQPRM
jgi:hypothetical protein